MWCYICLSCQFIRNPPPELQIDWFYWFYWFYWLSHPNIHLTLKVQHVRTASTSCCRQTVDICATSELMFVHVVLIFLFLNRFWRIAPFKGVDSRDWLGWWNTDTRWHKRSDSIGWQVPPHLSARLFCCFQMWPEAFCCPKNRIIYYLFSVNHQCWIQSDLVLEWFWLGDRKLLHAAETTDGRFVRFHSKQEQTGRLSADQQRQSVECSSVMISVLYWCETSCFF